jgi:hypothetical protein
MCKAIERLKVGLEKVSSKKKELVESKAAQTEIFSQTIMEIGLKYAIELLENQKDQEQDEEDI